MKDKARRQQGGPEGEELAASRGVQLSCPEHQALGRGIRPDKGDSAQGPDEGGAFLL